MTNIYNLFKFLKDRKGKEIPFETELRFIYAPETLTKEELDVEESLYLAETPVTTLPDNLTVDGNLYLTNTNFTSIPNNLYVNYNLFLGRTPLSKKYSREEIRKMIEDKGGQVGGEIFTFYN